MLYHSAMIAAALDDKAAARATLQKLLAAATDFPEIAEAKALLAQLGG
jgi:TolA-binding protein